MLTKFTVLTQLNSWSAAPWPRPGKLDVVVKKNKREREGREKGEKKRQKTREKGKPFVLKVRRRLNDLMC